MKNLPLTSSPDDHLWDVKKIGGNCIQNFHLGRYIVGYTVGKVFKDSENVLCCTYTSSGSQLHKTACQLHIFTCQPMKSEVT